METRTFVTLAREWVRTGDKTELERRYPPASELAVLNIYASAPGKDTPPTDIVPPFWLK